MAVYRVHKTTDYTVMANTHLRDKDLSLKAKGMLSVMLSLPDDWEYSVAGLTSLIKEGRTTVTSALKELEEAGYVRVSSDRDDKGKFQYFYDVFETPEDGREPQLVIPGMGEPSGKRQARDEQAEKPKRARTKKFEPPSLDDVRTYCEQRGNDVDPKRFHDYFEASGWVDSQGKPVRNWKQKVITWEGGGRATAKRGSVAHVDDGWDQDW